jgi:hypothetical protein
MDKPKPIVKAVTKTLAGYSTKYALTQGISKVKIDLFAGLRTGDLPNDKDYVYTAGRYHIQLIVGKTFFESIHDAEANARLQAKKKLVSLDKQRAEMVKLSLEPKMETDD